MIIPTRPFDFSPPKGVYLSTRPTRRDSTATSSIGWQSTHPVELWKKSNTSKETTMVYYKYRKYKHYQTWWFEFLNMTMGFLGAPIPWPFHHSWGVVEYDDYHPNNQTWQAGKSLMNGATVVCFLMRRSSSHRWWKTVHCRGTIFLLPQKFLWSNGGLLGHSGTMWYPQSSSILDWDFSSTIQLLG